MKANLFSCVTSLIVMSFAYGCVPTMTGARVAPGIKPVHYVGPRVSIAVSDINNRTGVHTEAVTTGTTIQTGAANDRPVRNEMYRDPIGSGMRDQLITALTQTGAFTVSRNIQNAQYVIEGAITEYEPSQASIAGGYGWGRNPIRRPSDPTVSSGYVFAQILAENALGGFGKQDYVAMSIHLVDRRRDVVVASTTVEATPKDLGFANNLLFGGGQREIVDVGGQMKTPMQKAIRACMTEAAVWAANTVQSIRSK